MAPGFVEVLVDRDAHVYPMIGPGQGYKRMICGPHITPRIKPRETEA